MRYYTRKRRKKERKKQYHKGCATRMKYPRVPESIANPRHGAKQCM